MDKIYEMIRRLFCAQSGILLCSQGTRIHINNIYNLSWYGSVLWDIFSPASTKIKKKSVFIRTRKVTMELHYSTHRELIEQLSKSKHVKVI